MNYLQRLLITDRCRPGDRVVDVCCGRGLQLPVLYQYRPDLARPLDFGKSCKRTFDYVRTGTTDLYAVLDIRTGKVLASLSSTHTTSDFLRLMKKVASAYPGQKVHVIVDNASAHLSGETGEWLVKQKGRFVFHFTPTGASWMNQIEIWNGILTRKVIRCGTFTSVRVLDKAIEAFVEHWNGTCQGFRWTATAEEILDKVRTVTAHMDALLHATEINDVASQAA